LSVGKKKGSYLNLLKTSTQFFTTENTESWPQVHIQSPKENYSEEIQKIIKVKKRRCNAEKISKLVEEIQKYKR